MKTVNQPSKIMTHDTHFVKEINLFDIFVNNAIHLST